MLDAGVAWCRTEPKLAHGCVSRDGGVEKWNAEQTKDEAQSRTPDWTGQPSAADAERRSTFTWDPKRDNPKRIAICPAFPSDRREDAYAATRSEAPRAAAASS